MQLQTRGFKAHDVTATLGPRTVLFGDNGTGKSTVVDGLRWVLLGLIPSRESRTLQGHAALFRDGQGAVTLTLDDGRFIERTFTTRGQTHQSEVRCSWLGPEANQDEHVVAALDLVGAELVQVEEALDVRTILRAKPADRAARLERLLGGGSTLDTLTHRIVARTLTRLTGFTEEAVERAGGLERLDVEAALMPLLPLEAQPLATEAFELLRTQLREHALAAALAWAGRLKRDHSKAAKSAAAAADQFAQELGQAHTMTPEDIERLEDQRSEADRALGVHEAAVRDHTAYVEAVSTHTGRRTRAQDDYDEAVRELAALDDETVRTSGPDSELQRIADELTAARAARDAVEAPTCVRPQPAELDASRERIDALERALDSDVVRLDTHLGKAQAHAIEHGVEPLIAELGAARGIVAGMRQAEGLVPVGEDGPERLSAMRSAHADLVNRDGQWAEYETTRGQRDVAVEELVRSDTARRRVIDQDAKAQAARREKFERARDDATRRHEEAQTDLDRLVLVHAPAAAPELAARAKELTQQCAQARKAEGRREELERLRAVAAGVTAKRDLYAALEEACKTTRAEEVAKASPLTEAMSTVLNPFGREAYVDVAHGKVTMGWRRPGGLDPVDVSTLSGGELVAFVAAMQAAVALDACGRADAGDGPELRFVLVEAAECDERTLQRLAEGLYAAVGDDVVTLIAAPRAQDLGADWLHERAEVLHIAPAPEAAEA